MGWSRRKEYKNGRSVPTTRQKYLDSKAPYCSFPLYSPWSLRVAYSKSDRHPQEGFPDRICREPHQNNLRQSVFFYISVTILIADSDLPKPKAKQMPKNTPSVTDHSINENCAKVSSEINIGAKSPI
ncbi:hypothetical protein LIPSTDRAFT_69551 [Lipomyces starkeyi NRRL Y-11557]|uniref:Uncharacterized protein n=1 Tax=Lipomyces starkeyi NRRL Y-11557 TaxID=675824 RepID=A0A1E3QA54_LIPST|nr:hypothetical protein LIPSTDRAFT_69551 [Lipomyces starkeyi NRRL Y-11557]